MSDTKEDVEFARELAQGLKDEGLEVIESRCKLCGKPKFVWQVFCGAACCARWESGERPSS